LCEHCHFDASDVVAVAALKRHAEHREGVRAERVTLRRLGPANACPRCWLPTKGQPKGEHCLWCGHDQDDARATAALVERRRAAIEQRRVLNRDRTARRAWRDSLGRSPVMTCPSCRQFGRFGMCEWCDFDATDDLAVEANEKARNAHVEAKARRRAELRVRLAPPSRRAQIAERCLQFVGKRLEHAARMVAVERR